MCVSSVLFDYGRSNMPMEAWNQQNWNVFQKLLHDAAIFDSLTNQPDCVDPEKENWTMQVLQQLRRCAECGADFQSSHGLGCSQRVENRP